MRKNLSRPFLLFVNFGQFFMISSQKKADCEYLNVSVVTLFCQCLHNYHLLESIEDHIKDSMALSAQSILMNFYEMPMNSDQNLSGNLYQDKK
jgi:hypothetical protein